MRRKTLVRDKNDGATTPPEPKEGDTERDLLR